MRWRLSTSFRQRHAAASYFQQTQSLPNWGLESNPNQPRHEGVPMPTAKRTDLDACSLLDADHRNVKKLFKAYDELPQSRAAGAAQKKRELANEICMELTVHAQIEEEIFYPALRQALKETDLL